MRSTPGVLVVCVALLGGCSADPRPGGAGPEPTQASGSTPTTLLTGTRDLADAEPVDSDTDLRLVDTVSTSGASERTSVGGVFEDGRLLLATISADPESNRPAELLLRDPEVRIPTVGGRGHYVADTVVGGHYVVWTETTSSELSPFPWVMYAFDTRTRSTTKLAASHDVEGGPPPPPGFSSPVLADGKVAWIQADSWPPGREAPFFNLYGLDLEAGGKPRLLARNAKMPAATADGVTFARDAQVAGRSHDARATIQRVDWNGTEEILLGEVKGDERAVIFGVAAAGSRVSWIQDVDEAFSAILRDTTTGEQLVLRDQPGGCLRYPKLTEALLVLPDGNCSGDLKHSGYLVFLDTGQLRTFGTEPGLYGVDVGGDWLVIPLPGKKPGAVTQHVYRVR